MRHIIFTRLALDDVCPKHLELQRGDRTESMWGSRKPVKHVIAVWRQIASQCYEAQTVPLDFSVVLLYSKCNTDLVDAHKWPHWVRLCEARDHSDEERRGGIDAITHWVRDNVSAGEQISMSRIDADDSWATDWFEFLQTLPKRYDERTLLLYHLQMQYEMSNDLLAGPFWHPSPMFATVYWPAFPADYSVDIAEGVDGSLFGVLGNHAKYASVKHVGVPRCYVMQRFGMIGNRHSNIMSRFGYIGNRRLEYMETQVHGRDARFVGYGDISDES